jgi:hypothetical protein
MQVILVRPWRSASINGGCCSAAPDSVALQGASAGSGTTADHSSPADHACHGAMDPVAQTYRLLRDRLPDVDVQMTTADNILFLLPATYRAARRKCGWWEAARQAARSTTAGAVIVDGEVAGDIQTMGPEAVLDKVQAATV